MSLRLAHELGMALALSLALMSVLLGGELPSLAWLTLLLPWCSLALVLRGQHLPAWLGTAMALGAALLGGGWLFWRGVNEALLAAALVLLGVLGGRVLTRQTMSHDGQALMLSLLCVFAGTVLHQQFSFGIVFVLYAIAATWALVTRQLVAGAAIYATRQDDQPGLLRQLGRRDVVTPAFFAVVAGVALSILMASSVLFMAFPRLGQGSLGLHGSGSGQLPANVNLAGSPRALLGGSAVVARLRGIPYDAYSRGLYLRARMYDRLDAHGFSRSETLAPLRSSRQRLASGGRAQSYDVYLQPVTDVALLSLGAVDSAHVLATGFAAEPPQIRLEANELLLEAPPTAPLRYRVHGDLAVTQRDQSDVDLANTPEPDAEVWEPPFQQTFLSLPPQLDPRILALARDQVAGAQGYAARAQRLRRFLLHNFRYSLVQTNAARPDPLAAFLFDDRRGHCEYFASAFAVLLRAVGIPSRVVGGYQGGVWDDAGALVVFTGGHAHAWVEWYQPERGWVVDDATPERPATVLRGYAALMERMHQFWDDNVVDFGLPQQVALLTNLVSTLKSPSMPGLEAVHLRPRLLVVLGIGLALVLVLLVWWRRRWGGRQGRQVPLPLTRALVAALERLLGAPLHRQTTLRQATAAAEARLQQHAEAGVPGAAAGQVLLQDSLRWYEARRFGPVPAPPLPPGLLQRLRRLGR